VNKELKKYLESVPLKKRNRILLEVRKIVSQHIKKKKPEFDMEKRVRKALRDNILSEKLAHYLLFTLGGLKKDKEFQEDWKIILKEWKDVYYGPREKEIYFHSELARDVAFGVFLKLWHSTPRKGEVLKISRVFKNEIRDFLERWRIDGVVDGNPLVDIDYYRMESSLDYASRPSIKFEIPLIMSVEDFRNIIGREYSKAKRQYYDIVTSIGYPRAKWGTRTGKSDYYLKRDKRVVEAYLKLREKGMTIEKALEIIYYELDLEKDMSDAMSLKPIIYRIAKSDRK